MVVRCNNVYTGQFDPTLNVTYEVVTKVMEYVNKFSEDPYIHFGGDETSDSCWDLKPSRSRKVFGGQSPKQKKQSTGQTKP